MTALVLTAALAGLLLGSFANVVIHRVPRGESVISPPSACPWCGARLRWWQNVPVLSFAVLRGRCATCRERISWRYPLVEIGVSALFALTAIWRGPVPDLPVYLALAFTAVVLGAIDLAHRRIPNAIVLPVTALVLAGLAGVSAIDGSWGSLARAAAGGALLFCGYLLLALAWPAGMGMGDVKLAGLLGIALGWIGWGALVVGAFAGFVVGAVAGVATAVVRGGGRRTAIPYAPSMLVGATIGAVWGPSIAGWYLGLLGLA